MTAILILLPSFVPSLLMFFFLRRNREDPGYRSLCGKLLLKGVICAAGVTLAAFVLQLAWNMTRVGKENHLIDSLFNAFILAAAVEEGVKFFTARKALKEYQSVSRLDVIAFMAIAAMGFGLIEDVIYAFESNVPQILVRGILMAHVGYGLLMGLLYGKGLAKNSGLLRFFAVFVPLLIHGLYDFSLDENLPEAFSYAAVLNALAMAVFTVVMIFYIRKKRKDPEYTKPIYPEQ